MYATPAARQLPVMAGAIAGVKVVEPPQRWLGDYIAPGAVGAIDAWLERPPERNARAFIVSSDMLAYGGLDPSRAPGGISQEAAITRLGTLRRLRAMHPHDWIAAFGTIMRLEPTAVAPVGAALNYSPIAQPPTWEYIWELAGMHDPPLPSEAARATRLRAAIGEPVLQQYLQTRERDRNVDLAALQLVTDGTLNRIVIGQDDAGPVGLHVKDVRALQEAVVSSSIADRASIEPGADELGVALVAQALARSIHWTPRVAVRYSTPDGVTTQDPLEYAPVHVTIDALIRLCGGVHDDTHPDITLYVRVPHTTAEQDDRLIYDLQTDIAFGRSVALIDLTFLTRSYDSQAAFVRRLIAAGIAAKLDAYSSWNTTANSVGIALAEAVAANIGRRTARYDPLAHAAFMLDRYIDDYLYHDIVRPQINADLAAHGVPDHDYLAPNAARLADQEVRTRITPLARQLLTDIYPNYRAALLRIDLPWPRTFEIESQLKLVPRTHLVRASPRLTTKRTRFPHSSIALSQQRDTRRAWERPCPRERSS